MKTCVVNIITIQMTVSPSFNVSLNVYVIYVFSLPSIYHLFSLSIYVPLSICVKNKTIAVGDLGLFGNFGGRDIWGQGLQEGQLP